VTQDVAISRGGPKQPVTAFAVRAPGSVRRTSTINLIRPDGPSDNVVVTAAARDLRTTPDGVAMVLDSARCNALIPADPVLQRLHHPDPRLEALLALSVADGFRGKALTTVPERARPETGLGG